MNPYGRSAREGIAPHFVAPVGLPSKRSKTEARVLCCWENIHFAERVATRAYALEKVQVRFQGGMAHFVADDVLRVARPALQPIS